MYMWNLFSHLALEALCVGAIIVCVGGKGMVSKEINKGQWLERENQTTKIHWRHIKIFSKTIMPILIKLDTTHLFFLKETHVFMNKGPFSRK